ncbi:hypothetical protein CLOM_g309 [Closterium sp. NIES-68]|nr:hypothetical protein CLOM_g309 [Closterium sp. NIES-68]GJP86025.1 hypothetical protein CLOP_g16094 [Closterium sp. NIES-67]
MLPVHYRLLTALMETIGAPIKLTVAAAAAHDTGFRARVILFAQAFHRMNVRLHRKLDTRHRPGHHRNLPIRPLNEESAVDMAAHLVGEIFVFGVGGSIIVAEVAKQGWAEARKEEEHRRDVEEASARHQYLEHEIQLARERLVQVQASLDVDEALLPPLPPRTPSVAHDRSREIGGGGGRWGQERQGREEEEEEEEEHERRDGEGSQGQEGLDEVREREKERTVERREKEERRHEEEREEEEKRRMGFFMPRVLSTDFGFGPPM